MPPLEFPSSPANGALNQQFQYDASITAWRNQGSTQNVGTAIAQIQTSANQPNYVINGGMDIWQRGDSLGNFGPSNYYSADRWESFRSAWAAGMSVYRVASDLVGFNYYARIARDNGNTSTNDMLFDQPFETVEIAKMRGKVVTVSFYARKGSGFSSTSSVLKAYVQCGTGVETGVRNGFTNQTTIVETSPALTTTWTRYSYTFTVPTTATQMALIFGYVPVGTASNDYFDITGIQMEDGSVPTPFRRNGHSIQGELAACQRYYEKVGMIFNAAGSNYQNGFYLVQKRIAGTLTATSGNPAPGGLDPRDVNYFSIDGLTSVNQAGVVACNAEL